MQFFAHFLNASKELANEGLFAASLKESAKNCTIGLSFLREKHDLSFKFTAIFIMENRIVQAVNLEEF